MKWVGGLALLATVPFLVDGSAIARERLRATRHVVFTAAPGPSLTPVETCLAAIAGAEARYGTPPGLLLEVARAESGRYDVKTSRVQPWPWAVNTNGVGSFLPSLDDAVTFVSASLKTNPSVDTGCMQVNLQQHPAAFRTIADAFDPMINADYAARYLVKLHSETGDWVEATGFYHSHTPALALPYRTAILARLGGAGPVGKPVMPPAKTAEELTRGRLAQAWAVTLADPGSSVMGWTEGPRTPSLRVAATGVPLHTAFR